MKHNQLLLILSMLLVVVVFQGCKDDDDAFGTDKLVADYPAEAALRWNQMYLDIERYMSGYRPAPAPRSLAYMGLAAYEACVTGMPAYNSLEYKFDGLNIPNVQPGLEYHWPTVVHAVYTSMMPRFFTQEPPASVRSAWNALINELNQKYANETTAEIFNRSKEYGTSVGNAVWDWSTSDAHGHEAYKNVFMSYNTGETYDWQARYKGPGDWVPTVPGPNAPMGPFFGKMRTFGIKDSEKLSLPPSAYFMTYSEDIHSEYYSQALQTYTKNASTDYQVEWIGEFWSDDLLELTFSPGPRWIAIGNQIIESKNVNLEKSLEAYAKTGMALNDAAVACWHSKFHYNVERPVTYINKVIDPTYKTNLDNPLTGDVGMTPAFPAYPSGHSTMGGAGAETLASVFGYAYAMTDNCHLGRTEFEGVPRTFGSLYEMAVENSWSRVLLGVHWKMDCEEGVRFGTAIGRKINALPWKK